MSTINNILDTNKSSSPILARVMASRYNRFINFLSATFRYDSVAKELSNIKQLTDETAKNHIDLTCRQIRNSKDFSEALKFAQNAKESVRLMDHFPNYMHALGEALMDQVAEHQGIKMTRIDQVSTENQTQFNDAIISIVRLTRFACGTPEIVRSKIGERIEENLTAQELIRSYKDAYKTQFLQDADEAMLTKYEELETKRYSNPTLVDLRKINFEKRQLYPFKERNKVLDTYRKQLKMLGLHGVYDDITMPEVVRKNTKIKANAFIKHEHTIWAGVKGRYEKAYSDFKQQISLQTTATKPATNRDDFEETTVLFPNNSPSVTVDEQEEIKYETIEIKQSMLDRIKDFFKNLNSAPPRQMDDLTISLFDDSDTAEKTTAHFDGQVLPELRQKLEIDDTAHDDFLMPENSDMTNDFEPTLLQRIKAALKGFFSKSENSPVFELVDSNENESTSDAQEQSGSPTTKPMPEFIAQAFERKFESPFKSNSEEAIDEGYDELPSCTRMQREAAIELGVLAKT